ncbi:MAG: hypothetical protein A3B44_02250 [Candidatus Levybacteria bacterium RIFCSPLOWO2_01_FULL_38_21]|nr:MAG: hypothetical protein A3B44_02250 [Candidatus Levybacteria bacterium RIFCSPLOWO2_01_FULL_38_21]
MKPQDIIFFIILLLLLIKRDSKLAAGAGIISLILAIPLFSFWIFFTAERFTWYAAAFFLLTILFQLFNIRKNGEK